MHNETVDRSQLMTRRIEDVELGRVLGIESEHRRGGRQAHGDGRAGRQIEPS